MEESQGWLWDPEHAAGTENQPKTNDKIYRSIDKSAELNCSPSYVLRCFHCCCCCGCLRYICIIQHSLHKRQNANFNVMFVFHPLHLCSACSLLAIAAFLSFRSSTWLNFVRFVWLCVRLATTKENFEYRQKMQQASAHRATVHIVSPTRVCKCTVNRSGFHSQCSQFSGSQ